jgi:hypothetical protein
VAAAPDGGRARPLSPALAARSLRGVLIGTSLWLAACTYDVTLGENTPGAVIIAPTTHSLAAVSCGTWNSVGSHTVGPYLVGRTTVGTDDTISYFVFDLTLVQGKKLTGAKLSIPGTSDWKIAVPAQGHDPLLQFKLGVTPLPASLTLTQVTEGSDDPAVYGEVLAEQDLGFGWVSWGAATTAYEAFHYDNARLQRAVDTGGLYPIFAVQRFGETASTAEYLYGGGVCGPDIVLNVTVD